MKERPILMQADNIKAILEDRKTQTRRVIKPQPKGSLVRQEGNQFVAYLDKVADYTPIKCPYGQVGDRLWVREAWRVIADGERYGIVFTDGGIKHFVGMTPYKIEDKWKPSFLLPRWASRITLEITGVRVERINDISYEDARAEGFLAPAMFREKWDSLNAKRGYGWNTNPWVWVIEFKRIDK